MNEETTTQELFDLLDKIGHELNRRKQIFCIGFYNPDAEINEKYTLNYHGPKVYANQIVEHLNTIPND